MGGAAAVDVLAEPTAVGASTRGAAAAGDGARAAVTDLHVTAFGRFHGVAVNPTELLLRALPAHLARAPLPPCARLASATVLQVAAAPCRALLARMHAKVGDGDGRVAFVHLGVDSRGARFQLEGAGYNEASFGCADEAGWAPAGARIDPDALVPLAAARRTVLPLGRLAAALRAQGFDVGLSADPGRFVCNWVYYESLRMGERSGAAALFVHVPPAEVVSVERQTLFCAALLRCIAELPLLDCRVEGEDGAVVGDGEAVVGDDETEMGGGVPPGDEVVAGQG